MKKLKNPFSDLKGYNCFVCSPDNPVGLHLDFYLDGEKIKARWKPKDEYQGYPNVLHGGIQATLLDEVASWTVYTVAGTGGVTSRMEVQYKKPVFIDKGEIRLTAEIIEYKKRIISVQTYLFDGGGLLCTEAIVDYFVYPEEVARAKMHYPGKEAFFD
ncbi:MAG: PaaI family thioesterase [Candidatus Marinimicrobia bacterium]|nr:PaaI family thioesterase [Candidatus Neomarinimicrobiota bacterium]